MLDASAGADGPDYVITTVDDPGEARAGVRDGQLDALLTISRAADGDLSYLLYTDEGLTGGTPTAIRTAVYQVSVGDRLQRAGVGAEAGQILAPHRSRSSSRTRAPSTRRRTSGPATCSPWRS